MYYSLTILKILICSALIQREVHVEVLDGHIQVTNSLLIFLALHIQLRADLLEQVYLPLIVGNSFSIGSNPLSVPMKAKTKITWLVNRMSS